MSQNYIRLDEPGTPNSLVPRTLLQTRAKKPSLSRWLCGRGGRPQGSCLGPASGLVTTASLPNLFDLISPNSVRGRMSFR